MPLLNRISRILGLFTAPMALLAAGRLPRRRRGPHSGGAPHPETLRRGTRLRSACGWELEPLLAERPEPRGRKLFVDGGDWYEGGVRLVPTQQRNRF